jgi:hypothetical protein
MQDWNYDYSYQMSPFGTILSLAVAVLAIVAMWKIFEKAGEPGWAAIIPFYNLYVLFKITWGKGWNFLLLLIPIANIVILIITMVKLAKAFGKSGGFAVGLIFLSVIFYSVLAFDQSQYLGVPEKA